MSEYRHFIAYMYEYEDGKKTKNAGFVKVKYAKWNLSDAAKDQGRKKRADGMSDLWIFS